MTDMHLVESRHRPAARGIAGLSEAVVDLSAVRDNVRAFRQRVPQDVLAEVKADAFGHGAVPVARAAVEGGATWLGVAHADEALQLRAAGLTVPILTWLYDAAELMLLGDVDVDVSVSTVAELQLARRAGLRPSVVHLANSAGAITLDAQDCNLVRIGAGLYGIDELGLGLRPAMRLTTKLVQVRRIRAGEGVSYGHDFVTDRDTTIGLVPIGYADGAPRVAVRRASVLCRGVRMPVIGRIAMDQFVVEAGDLPVEPGEPVTVFGDGSHGEPTAAEWADWAGTIPHEIYCGIGSRVARCYEGGAR